MRPVSSGYGQPLHELIEYEIALKDEIYLFCSMIQQIILGLIFLSAVLYVGRLVFRSFQTKSACTSGCGKCGAVDFRKIEKQIQEKSI